MLVSVLVVELAPELLVFVAGVPVDESVGSVEVVPDVLELLVVSAEPSC